MNLFNTNKINRVFPINLEQTIKLRVVVTSSKFPKPLQAYSLFSSYPNVQKNWANASSSHNVNTPCSITKYLTTGTSEVTEKLQDKLGYLILGGDCHGYSSGNFVSVYRLTDANKVELYGNFKLPWIEGSPGTSRKRPGNAYRSLWYPQPTIIVNYGSTSPAMWSKVFIKQSILIFKQAS